MAQKELSPFVELLGLERHVEGGWFKEIWKSSVQIPRDLLGEDYSGSRPAASTIYFLLHPGEISEWHTVLSDEHWLWHTGSPLVLSLGGNGDRPGDVQEIILGLDIAAGQQPQALVPAGVWQAARPLGDEPVLVSCVVAPGFHYDDFRLIDKPEK
ncbi:putative cupin superfamily sugar epimerase [Paenibacillus forsythiae]|uniref:Cupin superfamily sugar epimerase n=1 Tax=Paenibacillus forsythiae TaxID=365616 RepID=A0ABU3HEG7_9BACL|nr:cupin domain-containing protein [Paenibacillus forsythiae]MDT3429110.1 putative cupin superfamily sugar epimerase [Paenibacillus forsythiae]